MTAIGFPCADATLPPGWDQPLTTTQFRAMFAEFSDTTKFPDPMIQVWLDQAPVDPCVWQDRYQLGQGLWAAHELKKFGPGGLTSGGPNSGVGGIVSNKAVGPVSVGYDNSIGEEDGAGSYNLTIYGRQFWSILRLLPIGPIQVGPAAPPLYPLAGGGGGGAWIGPWPFPGPAQSGFSS